MARTTSDTVKALLGGNYDNAGSPSLTVFMGLATRLTDWLASRDTAAELGTDLLADIEANLAAHFYLMSDKALQSKNTGGAGGTFQGQTGKGLEASDYGQAALMLDVTGRLKARSDGRQRLTCSWGGKAEAEQLDYEDRNP